MAVGRMYVVTILLIISVHASFAQILNKDTILLLKQATVYDNRAPSEQPGLTTSTISAGKEADQAGFSLGELLSRNTASFIKQYSVGTLSSPALRGTGSAHTALVWNGFNLQSGINGQVDLNLIPAFLFDHFTVQQGANSAAWGSGAIGGTIFLENEPVKPSVRIQHVSGSWETRKTACSVGWNNSRLSVSIKGLRQTAINNFQFHNQAVFGSPIQRQVNAQSKSNDLLGDLRYITGTRSYFQCSGWWQNGLRHIPPILTIPNAVARQLDQNGRISGSWNWNPGRWIVKLRTAYFNETIRFIDSMSTLDANNRVKTMIQEGEFAWLVSANHRIQAGINLTQNKANSKGFNNPEWISRNRKAGFISWRSGLWEERLILLVSARQEWLDDEALPLIPSVSGSFRLNSAWAVRAQWAKSFRVPTMNDLYWIPGGNPDLKSESGTSGEVGITWKKQVHPHWFLESKQAVFSNHINNWILWTPGISYWTPENIQQVYSRGWEHQLSISWQKTNYRITFNSAFQHVRSQPISKANPTNTPGRLQLMYTPEFGWNHHIAFHYKRFKVELTGTYTGKRFVSSDNSNSLPAFYVLNATVEQQFSTNEQVFVVFLQVNNLLNRDYQVMQQRPMPLIHTLAGLSILLTN